jgi:hypothetical protein
MAMNNMVLWFKNGLLKAAQIEELPKAFMFEDRKFVPVNFSLGDVDYLRNDKKQLVGFSFIVGDEVQELLFGQRLAQQSQNVKFKDGLLLLFLNESKSYDIECVQAIGTEIYHDKGDGFIFVIPDWRFGELSFDLTSKDIPIASFN